jgi:60S ribosomal subunit assembly/export protein LOC1
MGPSRTATVKSKHAANKSGIRNSKTSTKKTANDGIVKNRSEKSKRTQSKGVNLKPQKSAGNLATLKKKRRVYTEKELDIPKLNMITPVGVEKPKGKKKGKVFVDDRVCFICFHFFNEKSKEHVKAKSKIGKHVDDSRYG